LIVNYQATSPSISAGNLQYSSYVPYLGNSAERITLADVLACCQANAAVNLVILKKLNLRGFRREKPSRLDLQNQIQVLSDELRDFKRLIRRRDELPGGGYNGPENKPL